MTSTTTPFEDLLEPTVNAAALIAAGKLGLLEHLHAQRASAAAIAAAIGTEEPGVRALLEVLANTDYVERDKELFQLTPKGSQWFGATARVDFTPLLLWAGEVWDVLSATTATVEHGHPRETIWERIARKPGMGATFANFMKAKSQLTVTEIADRLTDTPRRRLLDMGGAHGLHSMQLCSRMPDLQATVMDLPASLEATRDAIAAAGLSDRITLKPGSYLQDDLGSGYDLILCFEILHGHAPEDNQRLLSRAAAALVPGGELAVLEPTRTNPPSAPNAAFSLLMFLYTGTRTYGADEIMRWMAQAGLQGISQTDVSPSGGLNLLRGSR